MNVVGGLVIIMSRSRNLIIRPIGRYFAVATLFFLSGCDGSLTSKVVTTKPTKNKCTDESKCVRDESGEVALETGLASDSNVIQIGTANNETNAIVVKSKYLVLVRSSHQISRVFPHSSSNHS